MKEKMKLVRESKAPDLKGSVFDGGRTLLACAACSMAIAACDALFVAVLRLLS